MRRCFGRPRPGPASARRYAHVSAAGIAPNISSAHNWTRITAEDSDVYARMASLPHEAMRLLIGSGERNKAAATPS
jgi:hypothetical protein